MSSEVIHSSLHILH